MDKAEKIMAVFVAIAAIGIILVFVGITMPDNTLQESLTFFPGFILYFGGLLGAIISGFYISNN